MDNVISLNIPESWSDVNIGQYQEFMQVEEDKTIESPRKKLVKQLSILCDYDESLINKLPAKSMAELIKAFDAFKQDPNSEFKSVIEVGGKKYGFQKDLHNLTLGEWIDLEHYVTTNPIENLHKMIAVLYRPIITEGDEFFDYSIKTYEDIDALGNARLFRDNVNIQDVYGVVLFFLSIVRESLIDMHSYFQQTNHQNQQMMIQAMEIVKKEIKKVKKKQTQNKKKEISKNGNGSI
jgi:hypothetical protein